MQDTNYWIGGGVANISDGNFGGVFCGPNQKTTTSFGIDFGSARITGTAYWEVKGYI